MSGVSIRGIVHCVPERVRSRSLVSAYVLDVCLLALDHVVCSLNPYHALRRVLLFILLQLVVVHREGGIQI